MPRDLFGDVTRPSISIGNRKWYSVPVSLLSHSAILATVVVLPIVAAPLMPSVFNSDIVSYMPTVLPPTLPPPIRVAATKPVTNPDAAPTVAPDTIAPEKPVQFEPVETSSVGVIGGADNIESVIAPPPVVVAPPKIQEPVRVGSTVRTPVKTRDVRPVYPRVAQDARIEGVVIIEATISQTGQVMNMKLLRGAPLLDQAALEAVRQWEFTPTLLNGVPVPVIMTVPVTFTLSR